MRARRKLVNPFSMFWMVLPYVQMVQGSFGKAIPWSPAVQTSYIAEAIRELGDLRPPFCTALRPDSEFYLKIHVHLDQEVRKSWESAGRKMLRSYSVFSGCLI